MTNRWVKVVFVLRRRRAPSRPTCRRPSPCSSSWRCRGSSRRSSARSSRPGSRPLKFTHVSTIICCLRSSFMTLTHWFVPSLEEVFLLFHSQSHHVGFLAQDPSLLDEGLPRFFRGMKYNMDLPSSEPFIFIQSIFMQKPIRIYAERLNCPCF